MTKPRGYRSAEMPNDPALLLRTLRSCRETMLRASRDVKIGCALYKAGSALNSEIDAVAALLTGDNKYFWGRGGGATDAEREYVRRWEAIERGEIPWPSLDKRRCGGA